jgi:exopolyphosphatase/guanosine-5'-triphosphate,3'-diphosphate pyrophosphatase
MTRVAAVDCGTNSVRLLVADIDDGHLVDLARRMEISRLGQGVDRTGRFSSEALERTLAVVGAYADECRRLGAEWIRMVATSATRDAANRGEFIDGVRARLGVEPEVVSGDEEAALSFAGGTRELTARDDVEPPYLVVDIGGGSTEFVLGDAEGAHAARSVDIGCVRLTERHFHSDPPTELQVEATIADIEAALDTVESHVAIRDARALVGLAGSVTTVAALALGLEAYDPLRIHHSRISEAQVNHWATTLLGLSHAERARFEVIHPGRVDVLPAGVLVLDRVMRRGGFADVVVSEHDILDGIAWSLVDRDER